MPLKEFECPEGKITEHYYPTQASVPDTIVCDCCGQSATRVIFSVSHFKVVFGSAFQHATKSDRRAWMKDVNVQGFSASEHADHKRGGPVKQPRDRLV